MMGKIVDYDCKYATYTGIDEKFVNSLDIKLPELYKNKEDMARYAKAVKAKDRSMYCKLPFDTFAGSEAIGADLIYDNSPLGPRKGKNAVSDPKEILELPALDPRIGRISEIIKACDLLKSQGETVALEIRGLFDTFNGLTDIQDVMMLWMTDPDIMKKICDKIRKDIIAYVKEAKEHCDILLYSDGSGGINVIGLRMGKQSVEWFTYPLMKEIAEIIKHGPVLQMCPKVSFMLTGCDKARFVKYEDIKGVTFAEAYMNMPEGKRLVGQMCNRELSSKAGTKVDYLELI